MNIAVIGSGISSLAAAYYLKKEGHRITLIEKEDRFGGHAHTVDVKVEGKTIPVDTGFLVFNDRTYPHLIQLFKELDIPVFPTDMSFSVQILQNRLEWSSEKPFLQKRNLFNLRFWSMIRQILRFNKAAKAGLSLGKKESSGVSLGDWVKERGFSEAFIQWYLIPMGAAIWSTPPEKILEYPALSLMRFFQNHGLLQVTRRPPWKTIPGGSKIYVKKIIDSLDRAVTSSPVSTVERSSRGIRVVSEKITETFDRVISGIHGIDNLKIIRDLNEKEKEVLKAFTYQDNKAFLHKDSSILPQNRKGWESWNYLLDQEHTAGAPLSVTYYINHLQPLDTETPLMVTLNPHRPIPKELVFKEIHYTHPLFDTAAIKAQSRVDSIQGRGGLYFTGAWQRYGFHEDGIWSAMKVVDKLKGGKEL